MINQITIIGVGLIGGSFAKALKKYHLARHIVGYSLNEAQLKIALKLDVIDAYKTDISEAVDGSEIIILATPVASFENIFFCIKEHLGTHTIISDVGSVKGSVIKTAKLVLAENVSCFIPAHPIAGSEKNGILASDAKLFFGKKLILTPLENNKEEDIVRVENIWQKIGAQVERMSAYRHDALMAMSSHLPHMLAFSLLDYLHRQKENPHSYVAGGFKDFSRIASSDATMWRDIALTNKDELLHHIAGYKKTLSHLSNLIDNQDGKALFKLFKQANDARDQYLR